MSSISSQGNRLPLDLLQTPTLKPGAGPSKRDFLWATDDNPLSRASKPDQDNSIGSAFIIKGTPIAQADAQAQSRKAAEGLVSATFIEPILKQIRESNTAPPPFGPSRAEKQFASLLDTKLSDEIVRAANFPLVERITNQLLKNMPQPQPEQSIDIQG